MNRPARMFVSYANEDENAVAELRKHCSMLTRQNLLSIWSDRKISPGSDWKVEIDNRLDEADLVVLVVTADFLESDYCFGIELGRALTLHKSGKARIVPVICRPCDWEESPFGCLQALPRRGQPISGWDDRDAAWTTVVHGFREVINELPVRTADAATFHDTLRSEEPSADERRVYFLAREYERIRLRLAKGDRRSLALQSVFLQMRGLVCTAWPLLAQLIKSPSPGERLCATAILQVRPDSAYATFLADCITSDKAFIGHRAAEALQCCARTAEGDDRREVLRFAKRAFESVKRKSKSERAKVLRSIIEELEQFPERPDRAV